MLNRRQALIGTTLTAIFAASASKPVLAMASAADVDKLDHVKVALVAPPLAHPHMQVADGAPKVVEYTMTVVEKEIVVDAAGTKMWSMAYNGWIPGPLMVVHEGDYVQLTLINPASNSMPHNIDFHASTGALGGGALTLVNPGEQTTLRFKATRPGVFVYHCAPPGMIPWHVVSGMNGAIMVLPRDGLKDAAGRPLHYDRLYYIGESDFYIPRDASGAYKTYPSPGDAYADTVVTMRGLTPTHVVFEGAAGSLTGDKAMAANVGETVLIVHSQANRDTRPHLIGGHGDYVWLFGKFDNPPAVGLETWFVPGGSATAALYTFRQPGIYSYVNHNLIEAAELGATAQFKVAGAWDNDLMTQVSAPSPIAAN
jgi:nitrite reductase (NO-forming)